jgi:hypothetical protein
MIIITILNLLLDLLIYYYAFAACIVAYRRYQQKALNTLNIIFFFPAILVFGVIDVAINWTVLFLIMGKSPNNLLTISDRFQFYHNNASGWKTTVATFVCEKLLNPIDPTGNHC